MIQKLCYVDPLYFIEHKLYNKASDPSSAYFDLFPEDLVNNYSPLVELEDFPYYIASGIYDNILYYDVCKHKHDDVYNLLISSDITVSKKDQVIYVSINFDKDSDTTNYIASMHIISYKSSTNPGSVEYESLIYFDTFQDLFGIIKNTIRQNTVEEMD